MVYVKMANSYFSFTGKSILVEHQLMENKFHYALYLGLPEKNLF